MKKNNHLEVEMTDYTHTNTHTLKQATVDLKECKCLIPDSGRTAQHAQGEHENPPRLDLIKYGTTNLAPIKFTAQDSHKFSILCAAKKKKIK